MTGGNPTSSTTEGRTISPVASVVLALKTTRCGKSQTGQEIEYILRPRSLPGNPPDGVGIQLIFDPQTIFSPSLGD